MLKKLRQIASKSPGLRHAVSESTSIMKNDANHIERLPHTKDLEMMLCSVIIKFVDSFVIR